jgi:hypothetical protein
LKRVVAGSHVHAESKTSFRYEATWYVEGPLLAWKAKVSLPGRHWNLAGGMPEWPGGSEAQAVREDVARSIDGLET